jgi:eukaryotic-like serine/threonine-protein kinase
MTNEDGRNRGAGAAPAADASGHMQAADSGMVGHILDGRYRVTAKLGEGGMGEVFAAEHVKMRRRVAIKLLRPEVSSNEEAVKRFEQEAQSASSIGHRNIIGIYDMAKLPDHRIYLAMELLDGAPLNDMLREPMSPERLLGILIQTGHGLAAAHAKGITHRDMKPENIFVTRDPQTGEEVPKILDFGIAKVAGQDGQNNLTRTGTIFGTPFYMAPEQALGQSVDARADIYAMGVILYEVFAGSVPFRGESFMGILTQHITAEPQPVAQRAAEVGRSVPPGIDPVITRAMAKDPDKRYQTMDELVNALIGVYRTLSGSGMSSYMEAYVPKSGMLQAQPGHGMAPTPMPRHGDSGLLQHPGGPAMHPQQHGGMGGAMPGVHGPQSGQIGYPGSQTPMPGGSAYGMGASDSMVVPQRGSKVGLIFAIIAVLAVGGGVAGFVLMSGDKTPEVVAGVVPDAAVGAGKVTDPIAVADAAVAVVPSGTPDAGTAASGGTPDAGSGSGGVAELDPVTVLVNVKPMGSEIYEGSTRLGKSPLNVKVVPGKPRQLTIKQKGYKDLDVDLDGEQEKVDYKLDRIPKTGGNGGHDGHGGTGTGDTGTGTTDPPKCDPKVDPSCALE